MKSKDLKIELVSRSDKDNPSVVRTKIRATHIPSGLIVECGASKSQSRNRNVALAMIEYGLSELGFE